MINMGCRGLSEIISSKKITFSHFAGKTIAIDAVFWLKRYYYSVTRNEFSQESRKIVGKYDISQTISLLVSIPDILRNNITPVFFFDPMDKNKYPNADAKIPYLENTPTSDPIKQLHLLQRPTELVLKYLDIPYYQAPRDAEADAAVYVKEGSGDMVVSSDHDALLYQAPIIAKKDRNTGSWKKVSLKKTLEQNGINRRELLNIAILIGTDENMGPLNGHVEEALEKVKQADNMDKFEQAQNHNLRAPSGRIRHEPPSFSELQDIFERPMVSHNLWKDISGNVDPSITDPDLSDLRRYLSEMLAINDSAVNELIDPIEKCYQ
jgi:flap endonuclease-1